MTMNSQLTRTHNYKAATTPKAQRAKQLKSHISIFWHMLLQSESSKMRKPLWVFPQRVKYMLRQGEGEPLPPWSGKGFKIIHIPFIYTGCCQ